MVPSVLEWALCKPVEHELTFFPTAKCSIEYSPELIVSGRIPVSFPLVACVVLF